MRILVVATVTPFLHGGADHHINGLYQALQERGHDTELLRLPFVFHPEKSIQNSMKYCEELDLSSPNA